MIVWKIFLFFFLFARLQLISKTKLLLGKKILGDCCDTFAPTKLRLCEDPHAILLTVCVCLHTHTHR